MKQDDYATFNGLVARTLTAMAKHGLHMTADELLEEIGAPDVRPAVEQLRTRLADLDNAAAT